MFLSIEVKTKETRHTRPAYSHKQETNCTRLP